MICRHAVARQPGCYGWPWQRQCPTLPPPLLPPLATAPCGARTASSGTLPALYPTSALLVSFQPSASSSNCVSGERRAPGLPASRAPAVPIHCWPNTPCGMMPAPAPCPAVLFSCPSAIGNPQVHQCAPLPCCTFMTAVCCAQGSDTHPRPPTPHVTCSWLQAMHREASPSRTLPPPGRCWSSGSLA